MSTTPTDKKKSEDSLAWAIKLLQQAHTTDFYGKLTVTFEAGKVVRVVNERSLKPPSP